MAASFKGKSVLLLLAINLLTQCAGFGLQVFIAHQFGASVNMDAYITGLALSQYVVLILNAGINASLLPAYYEKPVQERDKFLADLVAMLFLAGIGISLAGAVCADWLFPIVFSDLPDETQVIGTGICRYGFASVATTLLINVLTSIHFIRDRFAYQAMVPAVGQAANLCFVFLFAPLGVYSLLVAFLLAQGLQLAMLSPVLRTLAVRPGRLAPFGPAVRSFLVLILPMILSTIFIKATGLWDRFLAGMAAEGTAGVISHVDYASKIITGIAAISISALPTLIFPSISAAVARKDHAAFLKIVADGLFFTFFITAPVVAIGYFISHDVVAVLFERGRFTATDTMAVAALLQVYLFSVVLRGMGGVTGNALYALKLTKWVSILGAAESLLYIGYSYVLTSRLGVIAIPLSFLLYFGGSTLWALILIRAKVRTAGGGGAVFDSLAYGKVAAIATAAACATWGSHRLTGGGVSGIVCAVLSGGAVYLGLAYLARIELAERALQTTGRALRRLWPRPFLTNP